MRSSLNRTAIALLWLVAGPAARAEVFDTPVDTQVVHLPVDPSNPTAEQKRSCFTFAGFMVKEVDLGEVGANELSITPVAKGAKATACEDKIAGEMVIDPEDWSGYFDGVKGDFVLFDAEDGLNGGMPFAVYSAKTGNKLFEDSRKGDDFAAVAVSKGALVLRYRRVYLAPCSLMADPKGCWQKIVAATSLSGSAMPNCTAAYKAEMKRTPKFAKDIPGIASVIAYEVEARYAAGRLSLEPRPGAAECWLAD